MSQLIPEGWQTIARQFIAGVGARGASSPVRDDRTLCFIEYSVVPNGTFGRRIRNPGNELPGYCLPSLTGLCMKNRECSGNIVVHDCTRIDSEIVIGILRKEIDYLNNFSREVLGRYTLEKCSTAVTATCLCCHHLPLRRPLPDVLLFNSRRHELWKQVGSAGERGASQGRHLRRQFAVVDGGAFVA